ncbi:MAG TPA: MMPL family transporter [Solirubrobacterales bacterium]|nr:MMPL family transporter [Solirubrobacterales bacterium]
MSSQKGRPPISLRHPRIVLTVALLICAVLGVLGAHVEDHLNPTSLTVPGTESSRADAMLKHYFGNSAPFAILLRGPRGEIERQGPQLVRALHRNLAVTTISPWDKGSVARLHPTPRKALILVDFHVGINEAVRDTVPSLNNLLKTRVRPPVQAFETGFATLSRAIQDESISSSEDGELIALPILILVLLLVFRSPVAALIPLSFGALTVITSRGVLTLVSSSLSIDGFALTVSTMMGLALGVDYALLMVSRFREELAAGKTPMEAAWMTRRTAGRTTMFAGGTLFVSMLVSVFILPGTLLISLAGTVIIVVILSVSVATLVAPALLVLIGNNIDRWRIGPRPTGRSRLMEYVGTALRRPIAAAILIGGVVLLLATPALGLKTGPPSTQQLPTDNVPRKEAELIGRAIGPGWEAPFIIVAATPEGTMTEPGRLAALSRWERRIARDPGVQDVIGPAQVAHQVEPLRHQGQQLISNKPNGPVNRFRRLGHGLAQADGGVKQIRSGFLRAAAGAGLLGEGSGNAQTGALAIATGLSSALAGGEHAVEAIGKLNDGSKELEGGQAEAKTGAERQEEKLGLLHEELAARESQALHLSARLKQAAASDPSLQGAAAEAEQLAAELSTARDEADTLHGESGTLNRGQGKLLEGTQRLHNGTEQLDSKAGSLPAGLEELRNGATNLAGGLSALHGGAESLQQKLSSGYKRSHPVQSGLHRATVKVSAGSGQLSRDVYRLRRQSPGLFNTGYFLLSAVEGAPAKERKRAGTTISLRHGGQAAALLVIPRYTFNTPGAIALYSRLQQDAAGMGRATHAETGVAGGAAQLTDYNNITRSRIPWVVLAITIVTFLVMVLVLRALPLAALAVGLNLATVGVAFGVLTLLFNVPAGYPLGGHTYVDAVGAVCVFGVVFGLSIDYAVFLLMRMRESYDRDGDNAKAISAGLEKTARVITGAAAIMMAVFVVFAGAPIATVSQLGVGLAVAVLLDATVVRIVLLPALMLIIGDRIWWLPAPLARVLPELDLHGAAS